MNPSGPITSYKEVIEYFRSLCSSHLAVHQFGVGELSDIDIQTQDKTPTKYPLVFLIPQQSSLDRFGKVTLGFSMIVADIAKDKEDLEVNTHNNTFMIMQDLLSQLILTDYAVVDMMVETPVNAIPFIERFDHNLAGWTAELNVFIKSPFTVCDIPLS